MVQTNLKRQIPSGISVDGWFSKPDTDGNCTVFVDCVFSHGVFGGTGTEEVEFKIGFKAAEVIIYVSDASQVLKSSINRDTSEIHGERVISVTSKVSNNSRIGGTLSLETDKQDLGMAASAGRSHDSSRTVEQKTVESIHSFMVQHFYAEDNKPAWKVTSPTGDCLVGCPWDANESSRLKFKPKGKNLDDVHVSVQVRCRGEDIVFIEEIQLKDPSKSRLFGSRKDKKMRQAAAEQLIKKVIQEEGLPLSNPENRFGLVWLSDVVLMVE